MDIEFLLFIALGFILFLVSLSVHEAAHAWSANKLGDPTSKFDGRMSLNPLAHIDIYGTVIIPIILIISNVPAFGWAKPVMVNIRNFKNPPRDNLLTALAGPAANILFALVLYLIVRLVGIEVLRTNIFGILLIYFSKINIVLAFFNLTPIPPFDGGKIWHLILGTDQYLALESMSLYFLGALFVLYFFFSINIFYFSDLVIKYLF
jgi:Zn-dependent protease